MKTKLCFKSISSILLGLLLLSSSSLFAQKVVALHSPVNGVQYFNGDNPLQEAYAAAEVSGDTIYLPGGSMTPPATFEKQLVIYGAGHYPSATTATFLTKISGDVSLSQEASGFHLEGVNITGLIRFGTNEAVSDVTIKRCKVNPGYGLYIYGDRSNPAVNNTFVENIFPALYEISNLMSSMFFNNIIEDYNGYRVGSARSLIFLNNLFLHQGSYPINYANNCMFKNNIFVTETNNICSGTAASTWVNNIFCTSTTTPVLGVDAVLVDNYFMTRADVFVNQTGGSFSYDQDYHLQAGAAANLGDDGTETGVYGGFYPWKDESIPVNPHISSKTISPTSDANGMIQVDINVHAQDR